MKKTPTNRPRIEDQKHYKKIGKLKKTIADQIGRETADIYVCESHLKHIFNRHEAELASVGLTPQMFVDLVVINFNRIYKGVGNSLLLVLWNGKPKTTAIEMNYALQKGFYEIKTATVMRKDFFDKKTLLWKKK
ncbi:MAG: hypothetical protein FWC94_01690 [Bacteroidales bacterium]|nr:hypothetical protein [Bacteroidales bacterium]